MASGSFSASVNRGYQTLRVEWSSSESTENNNSTVTLTMYIDSAGAFSKGANLTGNTINVGGYTANWTSTAISGKSGAFTQQIGSASVTVPHNADGTLTVNMSVHYNFKVTLSGTYYDSFDASTSNVALPTIPRASTPSMGTATTNSAITINTNRASSSFTHTLSYSFGNASDTIATNVGASTSWTPPRSLAAQYPNATSGTGTLTCVTYNNGSNIGSKSINFTLNFDSGIVPTISASSISDGNEDVSDLGWNTMLTDLSYLQASISASGNQGSTISKYYCEYEGINIQGDNIASLNTSLKNQQLTVGNRTCKLWVVDSRGRESTKVTKNYTVTEYNVPYIASYNAERCLQNGTLDDDGTYLKITLIGGITDINDQNEFTVRLNYKLKSDSEYNPNTAIKIYDASTQDNTINTNSYIFGGGNISNSSSYDIEFYISDSIVNITREKEIGTGFDLIHYNASGKAIAFGKKSEAGPNQSLIEFGLPVDFQNEIYIDGQAFAAGDTLPYGAIVEYDGSTVPDGYIKELDDDEVYSTDEKKIGYWIDDKPVYRKVINIGSLPNNSVKDVQHNISNAYEYITIRGVAYRASDDFTIPLPFVSTDTKSYDVMCSVYGSYIRVSTASDRTAFAKVYIILEYTKTTD